MSTSCTLIVRSCSCSDTSAVKGMREKWRRLLTGVVFMMKLQKSWRAASRDGESVPRLRGLAVKCKLGKGSGGKNCAVVGLRRRVINAATAQALQRAVAPLGHHLEHAPGQPTASSGGCRPRADDQTHCQVKRKWTRKNPPKSRI